MSKAIKFLITLISIGLAVSASYPSRIRSIGSVPTDIPLASYNNMDETMMLSKVIINTTLNSVNLGSDLILSSGYGIEVRLNYRFIGVYPAWCRIPNERVGVKIILPFAYIEEFTRKTSTSWYIRLNYNGDNFGLNINIDTSVSSTNGIYNNFGIRLAAEIDYARNLKTLLISRIGELINQNIIDAATVNSYTDVQNDKNRVAELNVAIANALNELNSKNAEYQNKLLQYNNANQSIGALKTTYNNVKVDFQKCLDEQTSLSDMKKLYEEYKSLYTVEKEDNVFLDVKHKECAFLTNIEDVILIMPLKKENIFNFIRETVRDKNFSNATNFFNSKLLYINKMN